MVRVGLTLVISNSLDSCPKLIHSSECDRPLKGPVLSSRGLPSLYSPALEVGLTLPLSRHCSSSRLCSCYLLLARCSHQSATADMRLQNFSQVVISAGQDNSNQGLLLDESVPGCTGDLSHMTQHVACPFPTASKNEQSSSSGLGYAHPFKTAGNFQRVRLAGWYSYVESLTHRSIENFTLIRTSNYHQSYPRYKLYVKQIKRGAWGG